jgi:hypothetical protein
VVGEHVFVDLTANIELLLRVYDLVERARRVAVGPEELDG